MAGVTLSKSAAFNRRQLEIFVNGFAGRQPKVPCSLQRLEEKAQKALGTKAFDVVAGGAGAESSIAANRAAFDSWQILPRVGVDLSEVNLETSVFGEALSSPIMCCPMGGLEVAHRDAEVAVARGAEAADVTHIVPMLASRTVEECARVAPKGRRWMQLYHTAEAQLNDNMVKRAEDAGCSAIVLTLDGKYPGWRCRDLDLGYAPFLEGVGIAHFLSDPHFRELVKAEVRAEYNAEIPAVTPSLIRRVLRIKARYPGGLLRNLFSSEPLDALRVVGQALSERRMDWVAVEAVAKQTDLPLLVKGVLSGDDADKAVAAGVSGIVVSNHGGRQIDGVIPALDALPSVVAAVKKRVPVVFDSGIRTGADVFKAVCLGADVVCMGRPVAYGLAIDGAQGVCDVLQGLKAEFGLTMALAGCTTPQDCGPEFLRRRNCA